MEACNQIIPHLCLGIEAKLFAVNVSGLYYDELDLQVHNVLRNRMKTLQEEVKSMPGKPRLLLFVNKYTFSADRPL